MGLSLTCGDLRAGEDEGDGNLIIDEGIFLVQKPVYASQRDQSGYAQDIAIVRGDRTRIGKLSYKSGGSRFRHLKP
jgi:hypothetical protein